MIFFYQEAEEEEEERITKKTMNEAEMSSSLSIFFLVDISFNRPLLDNKKMETNLEEKKRRRMATTRPSFPGKSTTKNLFFFCWFAKPSRNEDLV